MYKKHLISLMALVGAVGIAANGCSSSGDDDDDLGGTPGVSGASTGTGGATSVGQGGKTSSLGGSTGVAGAKASGGVSSTSSGGRSGSTSMCKGVTPKEEDGGTMCKGTGTEAERSGVDMFIMMDRSSSMTYALEGGTGTRWEALHAAMRDFVTQAALTDLRAGIAFFPFDTSGADNASDAAANCQAENYAQPKVEIDEVSVNGEDIIAAMDDNLPSGFTPTPPALTGALVHAKEWQTANPGRTTVVVLVTDGYPTTCPKPGNLSMVVDVAEAGVTSAPAIKTYVVGLGGLDNLDQVAYAGDSGDAFIVDTASADVTGQLVSALLNISTSPAQCEFALPAPEQGTELDIERVQMIHKPSFGDAEEVPRVASLAACDGAVNGGWYYDNPANPTQIRVCPCTCASFGAGTINIRLGCSPTVYIE